MGSKPLVVFLSGLLLAADSRPPCTFPPEVRDRYGCVPLAYAVAATDCRFEPGFCFTLRYEEVGPQPKRLRVRASGSDVALARVRARSVCQRLMAKGGFEGCEVGEVVRRPGPTEVSVEVLTGIADSTR